MKIKKPASMLLASILTCAALPASSLIGQRGLAHAEEPSFSPNPIISRGVPAYSEGGTASFANDDFYYTAWQTATPDFLAYDLSGVPEAQREQVLAVWYNDSTFDSLGSYISRMEEPVDYVIEINTAAGGSYPQDGWKTVVTVKDNGLSSRQHLVKLEGANWLRMRVTKAMSDSVKLNLDVHDASNGVNDSWLFLGDSITAGGMVTSWGTSYAAFIHQMDERFEPAAQNGGIGGITSSDGRAYIDSWLEDTPVKYVSIAYGTNDCWGNPDQTEKYYENTKYMIDAILSRGKIPVLPTIPSSVSSDVGDNVGFYNDKVRQLYSEYGDKLVHGPDFEAFFKEHPEYLSSDGVHPSSDGYEAMREFWAQTMYQNVYMNGGEAGGEEPEVAGDLNGDGNLTKADAEELLQFLLTKASLSEIQAAVADLDKNGEINATDLALLKSLILESGEAPPETTAPPESEAEPLQTTESENSPS